MKSLSETVNSLSKFLFIAVIKFDLCLNLTFNSQVNFKNPKFHFRLLWFFTVIFEFIRQTKTRLKGEIKVC